MKTLIRKITLSFATLAVALVVFAVNAQTAPSAYAAARTASVTGVWSNTATWGGSSVPVAGDTVSINNNITVTVDVAAACTSITFPSGNANTTTVAISGTNSLTVSGTVTIPRATISGAALNQVTVGAGTLNAGSIAFTNGGTSVKHQITISTGTVTVTGDVTQSGSNGSATIIFTGAGTLNLGGTIWASGDGTLTTFAGSTVNYNGASQTVQAFTYRNLTLTGSGTKTSGGAISLDSNLVIGDGVTFSHGGYSLTVSGTTTIGAGTSGTLSITSTTGTKTFVGLVTINNGATWNNSGNEDVILRGGIANGGTFTAGSGTYTFETGAQALTGTFSIPRVTITGVTLTNNNTLTVGTALSGSGGLTQAAGADLYIGGTSGITTLTATAVGNTVDYTGAGQIVKGTTYDNLTLSGSGTKTAAAPLTVNNNLAVGGGITFTPADLTLNGTATNDGTLTVSTALSGGGTLTNGATGTLNYGGLGAIAPTLTASAVGNTVNYNRNIAGSQTVYVTPYYNLTLSGSGAKSIGGDIAVANGLSITGAVANLATTGNTANTLTLGGVNKVSGTWGSTSSSATHQNNTYFLGTGLVTVAAGGAVPTFSGLIASPSGGYGTTVVLTGVISAAGPVYPVNGETTISATINGDEQDGAVTDGAGGFSISYDLGTIPVSPPTYTITYSYDGGENLFAASDDTSTTMTVGKGTPILSVTNSPVDYDSGTHSATVAADVPGIVSHILTGGAVSQLNANTYAVTANFVPDDTASYNSLTNASAGNFIINKVDPVLSVTNSPVDYDGVAHAATVSAGGVAGTVSNVLTGGAANQTDAATYAVIADFAPSDPTNYNSLVGASAGNFTINKIDQAALTVTNLPVSAVYNQAGITAIALGGSGIGAVTYSEGASTACTINPVTGDVAITSSAGICDITATKAADTNYNEITSDPVSITVGIADQDPLTVTGLPTDANYGDVGITAGTAGGSGTGAVTFDAGGSTGCSVDENTGAVTIINGVGGCSITATKAADANYNLAISDPVSIILHKIDQAATYVVAERGTATTAAVTNNASLTIDKPAGVVSGDVLIANIAQINNDTITPTPPAGWTLIDSADLGGVSQRRGSVFYKVAGGAEGANYTFTVPAGSNVTVIGGIIAYSGVDTSTPFDAATGTITVSDGTGVSDSAITTATANAAVIMLGQAANGSRTWSGWSTVSPGVLTEILDFQNTNPSIGAAWAVKAAAGSTGAGSATLSGAERNGGILLALKKATDSGTPLTVTGLPSDANYGDTPTAGTAGGSGTGAVTFADDASACSVDEFSGAVSIISGTGTCTITATKAADDNYNELTSAPVSITIHKVDPVLSVTNSPVPYDGAVHAATVSADTAGTVSNILTGGAASQLNVGTYPVTADFAPDETDNYKNLTAAGAGNFDITQNAVTLSVTNSPVIYNGGAQAAVVVGSTDGTVSDIQYDASPVVPTLAGTYAVTADFVPDDINYESLDDAPAGDFTIDQFPVDLAGTREYDGTATADFATSSLTVTNAIGGDTVTVASGSGTLVSDAVGVQLFDNFGTLALGGAEAGNYTLTGATGSVTIKPSTDATLKASSTVKGQAVDNFGAANAILGVETAGWVNITSAQAADTSNLAPYITLFDPTNPSATVNKVVKYASGTVTYPATFAGDIAYANEAITDQDFFIAEVTAGDGITILYYNILVTIAPYATAPSAIDLTVGAVNPVGGVVNVAIPAPDATDLTGAVTDWVTATNDTIAFTVTDGGAAISTITIDGGAYLSGNDYVIPAAAPLTIVVTTTEAGQTTAVRTFTVTVEVADYATAPTPVILAAGAVNPVVGAITNVVIPAPGATNTTGAVRGWMTGTADTIKFTVTDNGGAGSLITIDGNPYTSGTDYTILAATPLTIVVTTDETGRTPAVRTFTVGVTAAGTDATLSNLTISAGTLTPAFAPGTTAYTDNVDNGVTSVTVTPTRNQAGATITVNTVPVTSGTASGAIPLAVGLNTITVDVTAEDTVTTDTYTIGVTRAAAVGPVCGNAVCEAGETTASCPADCPATPSSGGGGGSSPSTTNPTSNTTTSTIPSNVPGTITNDQTYSRPIQLGAGMITETADGGTSAVLTGPDGEITMKPNTLSTISMTIPSDTTVTSSADWSGKISPPIIKSISTVSAAGEQITGSDDTLQRSEVTVVIQAGSNTPMTFSNDVTIYIPVDLPDGTVVHVYTSNDSNIWTSEGTAVVQNGYIVYTTSHLTYFAFRVIGGAQAMTPEQQAEKIAFTDIIGHWAQDYINQIAGLGIVSGKSAGIFAPNDAITRAELTKIAVNAFGIPVGSAPANRPFDDVDTAAWYAPYIAAAKNAGIVQGYEGNIFSPNGPVNRAEALKILLGAAKLSGIDENYEANYAAKEGYTTVGFPDVLIGQWFAKYVAYAKDFSIVSGYADGTFGPSNGMTRAEVAKVIVKILGME